MAADLTLRVATFATPLGGFTVAVSEGGVVATSNDDPERLIEDLEALPRVRAARDPQGLARVGEELRAYFDRSLRAFETPVDLTLVGTPFAKAVLEVTRTIPYGELWTYGDVAALAGRPGAARAAGTALRRCPIELFVPCHRVVPAGPGWGGYGGHESRRERLLRLEAAI